MAGVSIPGFYYSTGTSSPVGLSTGFEAGAGTAYKQLENEQQAQIRGRQERRVQEKHPLDLDAVRAQTAASLANTRSTEAAILERAAAERRAAELHPLTLEQRRLTNRAAQQGITLTQQQLQDAEALQRAIGGAAEIPSLPSAIPAARPAGLQTSMGVPPLPNTPLSGGGGDEPLQAPDPATAAVGWSQAGSSWKYVPVTTNGRTSYMLQQVTPSFVDRGQQAAPTVRDQSTLGGIAPPFAPSPPPPAPPTAEESAADTARRVEEEANRRTAAEKTAVAGLSSDLRAVQNSQRMEQIKLQHDALREQFTIARARRDTETMAKVREQALSLQIEHAQRMSLAEVERLARTGDVSGVNQFLRAKSNGALSIEMTSDGKYVIFNNGVPSASGAVPRATMMTWLAAIFDPEVQSAAAQAKALAARTAESIASKAGDVEVEKVKGAQQAALEVVKSQNKGAEIKAIDSEGKFVSVVDKGRVTLYRLDTEVPGPKGTKTSMYVKVPLAQ